MFSSATLSIFGALVLASGAASQATAPQYGQCGGQGWTGATACPSGWSCVVSNPYYSQCLPGAASSTPTAPSGPSSSPSGSPTTTASAPGSLPTLGAGNSFIRAVEDPNFHQYLRSEVINTASDAVLGDYTTAAQFQIVNGQLIQLVPDGSKLYAVVEARTDPSVMKLKMSWSTTPASGANAGTFMWSGDTVEWSIPSIQRPQLNAWLVCPDANGNKDVYVNLGPYDYNTPPGCADETIHAYTAACGVICNFTWKWLRACNSLRAPFVTLYASPQSADLPKDVGRKMEPTTSLVQLVHDKVPALGPDAKFDGVWWLPGGDAQTMYSSIADFSKVDPVMYERRFLKLPDQGIVAVDISPPFASRPLSTGEDLLFVAHGLTGGSHEAYIRALLARAIPSKQSGGLGFRAIVLNFRGCNGSPVVTPRLYHAGSSDDIRHVVLWMCHTFRDCRIYGLGFSLGGNIITKYAGEEGDKCPFQALVTLANPWDFYAGHLHQMSTILGRYLYRYVLGGALRRLLQLHRRVFVDAPKLPIPRKRLGDLLHRRKITLSQWNALFTVPMDGFTDVQDYYRKISSSNVVQRIKVPCLAINSWDDPIVGAKSLPIHQVKQRCPWVILAVTRAGGHLGWYERDANGRIARWYVRPVLQFLAALVEYGMERRQKPRGVDDGTEFVRDPERPDVGFRELSQEHPDVLMSGVEHSKLFTGW
ncbi:Carbohydrate-Binding Module Family 1 protein [Trametes cinnabarina]|uniref:Carbohydrate-Binding Module Family 1 protein n=1 Tax=Pycnoporus cinnabarinus TaxID=5643 RepID=A0A060T0J0_PYCCI|nr:Carbohydrate-Binding Module Family 1 protein [Trametes cinnabarina]